MNKITERTSGKFSARVYQQHDALYFIRFFESDIYLPDSEFAADSEEEARAIADFELARLTEADDARADMVAECLRPYRVQVDAETERARQDVLAEIGRLRRLTEADIDDAADADSETEQLNIRLAREFNWGESVGFDNGSQ